MNIYQHNKLGIQVEFIVNKYKIGSILRVQKPTQLVMYGNKIGWP